jgi:hypothetical protein
LEFGVEIAAKVLLRSIQVSTRRQQDFGSAIAGRQIVRHLPVRRGEKRCEFVLLAAISVDCGHGITIHAGAIYIHDNDGLFARGFQLAARKHELSQG